MSAPITAEDRETARLAVSLVLKDDEAAWEPVAQLIADYRALAVGEVKGELESVQRRIAHVCAALE